MSATNCLMSLDIINKIINDILTQSGETPTLGSLTEAIKKYVNESSIAFDKLSLDDVSFILKAIQCRLGPSFRNRQGKLILSNYDLLNLSVLFVKNKMITDIDEDSTVRLLGERLKNIYSEDQFLENYYQQAPKSRMYVETFAKRKLVESFLYNDTIDSEGNPVRRILLTQEEINNSILKVLQELLRLIGEYLLSINLDVLKNYIDQANEKILAEGKKRTLSYDAIYKMMRNPKLNRIGYKGDFFAFLRYFPEEFVLPSNLDQLADSSLDPENVINRLKFNAYNAFVILSNFDNFVLKVFGKLVKIDDTKKLFASGRYVINNVGSNLYTTWRSTDEIWLDKEINTIGLLIITTTPYYVAGSKSPEPMKYLRFNQFNHVIGKLKRFSIGPKSDLKIEDIFGSKTIQDLLTESTKDYISKNDIKSMKLLIWSSRENPLEAWQAILEVMSKVDHKTANLLFGIDEGSKKGFNSEDINIFYTLHKEILGGPRSLSSAMSLKVGLSEYNYVANIAQIMDSVFKTSYIQYYEDSDTGEIKIRPLSDLSIFNIRKDNERKINNQLTAINYERFKQLYNINILKDSENKVTEVLLTIGDYLITYKPSTNELLFKKEDSTTNVIPSEIFDTYAIETLTGLDISSREFLLGWNNTQNTKYLNTKELLEGTPEFGKLALQSIIMTALNNEVFLGSDGQLFEFRSDLIASIKSVFTGQIVPGVNDAARSANVTNDSNYMLLDSISQAIAYSTGMITASLIKGGDGNSVSANALSRLGDSYIHQWFLQNFKEGSASKDFILLNNSAFLGLFQVKELKSNDNEVLASEKMTTGDMITSNFIHDFLGLISTTSGGNAIIYIIPQVISDKKFIGRLGIDLNASVDLSKILEHKDLQDIFGETFSYDKLPKTWRQIIDSKEYFPLMISIIQHDFKLFFDNIDSKITLDYGEVLELASKDYPNFTKRILSVYNRLVALKYGVLKDINIYTHLDLFDLAFYDILDGVLLSEYIDSLSNNLKARIALYINANGLNATLKDIIFAEDRTIFNSIVELYKLDGNTDFIEYQDYIGLDFNEIKSPKQFLDTITRKFNIENPSTPIELTDQIHYVELSDDNGRKHIIKEPLLTIMLERFKTWDSTSEFFLERFLATASSMLDRGFTYSIETETKDDKQVVKNEKSEIDRNVLFHSKGWVTKAGDISIAKVKFNRSSGESITVDVRDKTDVRSLVKLILKNKYKTRGEISYEVWSQVVDLNGDPIFTQEEITKLELDISKLLPEDEKYKAKGKVSGKLEELYLKRVIGSLSEDEKQRLVNEYKQTHDEKYTQDSEGNPLSDEQILNKIFRAPVYSRIQEVVKQLQIEELDELDLTLLEIVERAREIQINLGREFELKTRELVTRLTQEGVPQEEIQKQVDKLRSAYAAEHKKYDVVVDINPNVEKYSMLDYLFSEEWIASTVGHHMAHPDKVLLYGQEVTKELEYWIESAKKDAQNKRNVSVSATVLEFLLNLLSGIPSLYNVAVIDDIRDVLYNVCGDIDKKVKPYDGATWVNPLVVWLENASLGGSKAGVIKKQFVHFYNELTGNGGIIKTAGFGITNMTMRDMPTDLSIHKSMNSMRWKAFEDIPSTSPERKGYAANENIREEDADITVGLDGETIDYGDIYFFDKNSGKYFKRNIVKYNGDYTYTIEQCQVNLQGIEIPGTRKSIQTGKIYSNYDVWEMFGGEWSMELDEETRELVPSEESIIKTVQASCLVGIRKTKGEIRTQNDVHQFMKHSCVHYFATAGAVKQGGANINGKEFYTNGLIPNFLRIRMLLAGIQLDKEHSADNEDVSLMTQVISACISRGFTFDPASDLYKALAKIAEIGLKDNEKAIANALGKEVTPELHALIVDTYLKAIASDSRPNKAAQVMAKKLLEAMNNGENLPLEEKVKQLPLSDPVIYRQLESKIAIAISKAAIKIKIDGVLSMLCPSHERIKLYGDKLLHEFNLPGKSLLMLLIELLNAYDTLDRFKKEVYDLLIGRTYKVTYKDGTQRNVEILTPLDYYELKNEVNNISRINELVFNGRNLGHYNCVFEANIVDITGHEFPRKYNIFDLQSVHDLFEALKNKESKERIIELKENLQKDLLALNDKGFVKIVGEDNSVKVTKINNITPYEVILPKYFKSSFGLTQHDNLSDILEKGDDFFMDVQKRRFNPLIPDTLYDVCLKRADGRHVYIKYKTTPSTELVEKAINRKTVKGVPLRLNRNGEEMYKLHSKDDKVLQYELNGKSYEIIETEDIDHYINEFSDSWDIYVSQTNTKYLTELLKKIDDSEKKGVLKSYPKLLKDYIKNFEEANLILSLTLEEFNKGNATSENLTGWKLNKFLKTASLMSASLRKSLDLIASRIPAQSMQSFMPMKIVGFDNSDTNTAYVSTAQIWLQGSDFDIDTATFTRYAVGRDGKFIHWSSLANISSYELLKACDELPFPTGSPNIIVKHTTDLTFVINLNSILLDRDLKGRLVLNTSTVSNINQLRDLINYVNEYGVEGLRMFGGRLLTKVELDFVQGIIIEHNTGIFKRSDSYVLDATKNFMLTKMFDIIANPANLILALTPVDTATEPVKKKANDPKLKDARLSRRSIPGDPTVKIVGIYKNQTGKTGVGICATGLKAYFASFYSCADVLNNSKSTREELRRVMFGRRGLYVKGKRYYGLANSFTLSSTTGDPLPEIDAELAALISRRLYLEDSVNNKIREALNNGQIYTPNEEEQQILANKVSEDELRLLITFATSKGVDGAVLLSAMLSSATDNAKDGSLGKLNAGEKTLGIYIFGIVLGIPFEELSDIIMSPSGRVLSELTQGNAFDINLGLDSIREAIGYVKSGPSHVLQRLNINKVKRSIAENIYEELYLDLYKKEDGTVDYKSLKEAFEKEWKGEDYVSEEDGEKHHRSNSNLKFDRFLSRMFGKFVDPNSRDISPDDKPLCGKNHRQVAFAIYNLASRMSLDRRLRFGEGKPDDGKNHHDKDRRMLWKVVADFAKARLTAYADYDNFMALSTLAEGAGEFTTLGQILKLNLGIPSSEQEILKTLLQFESIFNSVSNETMMKEMGELFTIDAFFKDPEKWIKYYEIKLKKAINILDVVNRTPHFKKYLHALQLYDHNLKLTVKYRTVRKLVPIVSDKLDLTSKQRLSAVPTSNKLVDRFMYELWLKDSGKYFVIQKGLKYYDIDGKLRTASAPMKIYLSSRHNLATFKLWMETEVIPNLKQGFNGKMNGLIQLSGNRFISDLKLNSYDNTENYVGMIAYSLPISMSPRNDYEDVLFNQYKSEFDALLIHGEGTEELYKYYSMSDDSSLQSEHNISDLFYLYNAYCFSGQNGQGYLTKIFEDVRDIGFSKEYSEYVNELDRSGIILDIPEEYYLYYLTPTGSVYGATSSQTFEKSKTTFTRVLWARVSEGGEDYGSSYDDIDPYGGYDPGNFDPDFDPNGGGEDSDSSYDDGKKKNKKGREYTIVYSGNTIVNSNFRGFDPELRTVTIKDMESDAYFSDGVKKDIVCLFENGYLVEAYFIVDDKIGKEGKPIKRKVVIPFQAIKMYNNIISSESGTKGVVNQDYLQTMLEYIVSKCYGK